MTRRSALFTSLAAAFSQNRTSVSRWSIFELSGVPSAKFQHAGRTFSITGFEDGKNTWRLRFSPDAEGEWTYTTSTGQSGGFQCVAPEPGNHGPVQVHDTYHFRYADGTPYYPFGTTCYGWAHQGDALESQTLETLRTAPFNKLRMCIFPKWYAFNHVEPQFYPFEGSNLNPAFFQHLERRIVQLGQMGIEADLILFHPYDHWGYAAMPAEMDDRYLRYVIARFGAYRNVWWSLANEWDLMKAKTRADFDRFFHIVQQSDPYGRLRSIHHSKTMYDHSQPWVSHASIQSDEFSKTQEWLDTFRKPVILDECKYEGNIPQRWGNLPAQEMVRRFWLGMTSGVYVGHGETYLAPDDVLWWGRGGKLHGESAPRIAFLRRIVEESPGGLNPLPGAYYPCAARPGEYYLYFLDYHQPAEYSFALPETAFHAEVIDPWKMTIARLEGTYRGKALVKLPGSPYLAVRFRKAA